MDLLFKDSAWLVSSQHNPKQDKSLLNYTRSRFRKYIQLKRGVLKDCGRLCIFISIYSLRTYTLSISLSLLTRLGDIVETFVAP